MPNFKHNLIQTEKKTDGGHSRIPSTWLVYHRIFVTAGWNRIYLSELKLNRKKKLTVALI